MYTNRLVGQAPNQTNQFVPAGNTSVITPLSLNTTPRTITAANSLLGSLETLGTPVTQTRVVNQQAAPASTSVMSPQQFQQYQQQQQQQQQQQNQQGSPQNQSAKNQQTNTNVQAVVSRQSLLFQQFVITKGPKNGQAFVELLNPIVAKMPAEDVGILLRGAKTLPFKETKFDLVYQESMNNGAKKLKSYGMSDDQIKSSAPRQTYTDNYLKIKKILSTYFWGKVKNEKALTWATLLRTDDAKALMDQVCKDAQILWPVKTLDVYYLNCYWMSLDFATASVMMQNRVVQATLSAMHLANYVRYDATGKIQSIDSNKLFQDFEFSDEKWEKFKLLDSINRELPDKLFMTPKWGLLMSLTSVVPDARKLIQTWDFRRLKANRNKQAEVDNLLGTVVSLCYEYIATYEQMVGPLVKADAPLQVDLNAKSPFCTAYYTARNFIHTFHRSLKGVMFGYRTGEDTRSNVLASIEGTYTANKEAGKFSNRLVVTFDPKTQQAVTNAVTTTVNNLQDQTIVAPPTTTTPPPVENISGSPEEALASLYDENNQGVTVVNV
jgi:hypothetical protein